MKGYGDIEAGGLGYGDLTPSVPLLERGYGSPSQIVRIEIENGSIEVSHLGGSAIKLIGILPSALEPYRAVLTVNNQEYFLYSGIAGQGSNLFLDRDSLTCFSPPAPEGTYDLKIRCGVNFTQEIVISNAVKVLVRNRNSESYILNTLFPAHYATGSRNSLLDPILDGSTTDYKQPPLSVLLSSASHRLQEIAGSPRTVLKTRALRGDTLLLCESLLGFTSSGQLWLQDKLFSFTKEATGLRLSESLKKSYPVGEDVIYHAYS